MNTPAEPLAALARRIQNDILEQDEPVGPGEVDRLRAIAEQKAPLCTADEIESLVGAISERLFGLGVLEPFLADSAVAEIMINGPGSVWVERHGSIARTEVAIDKVALQLIVERIVAPLGLRVDRSSPLVDARLPDGSRVHIAAPPLAIDGPYLTIRRFGTRHFALNDFCEASVADVLADSVHRRQSMIISGGTGSGKTTLLNALSAHAGNERIVTIEDAAELQVAGDHVVRLEARPANAEGHGEVTVRTLVRNALRMRPDRLIVGEVRGAEALDMIQAMNTGHAGSLSTVHANSARQALRRLETLMLMSNVGLPLASAREQVSTAVDLVVHVERGENGTRKVVEILRVADGEVLP